MYVYNIYGTTNLNNTISYIFYVITYTLRLSLETYSCNGKKFNKSLYLLDL